MAENDNLQQRLQSGVEAARRGDRSTGQRLLRSVVQEDPENELAWIWLASCVNTLAERRECLERVLAINPNNPRAREALSKLGVSRRPDAEGSASRPRAAAQRTASTGRQPAASGGGGVNISNLLIGALAIIVIIGGLFGANALLESEDEAPVIAVIPTNTPLPATLVPTITPTRDLPIFDGTSLAPTLPATFTSTPSPEPSATATPTETPFPLSDFGLFIASLDSGSAQPDLYRYLGDGAGESLLGQGARDIAISPDGAQIAFIRDIEREVEVEVPVLPPEGSEADADDESEAQEPVEPETVIELRTVLLPELFVAGVNDMGSAQQITDFSTEIVAGPTWSPEGLELVFVSDFDGDEDLWYITPDGANLRVLTDNRIIDREPAWEPTLGSRRILFASDLGSIGSTEIYSTEVVEPGDEPPLDRLTNSSGSSGNPTWSHNGALVTFISDRGGDPDVYIMDGEGDGETLVTRSDGDAEDRAPAFSPDGRFIVFISNRLDDRFQTYLLSLDGDTLVRVTEHTRNDESVAYRPELIFRIR